MRHLDAHRLTHHDVSVRTTLTLDDDLASKLKDLARLKRWTFKEAVNHTLRRGLREQRGSMAQAPFEVVPHSSGLRAGIDSAKLNQVLDELEADDFVAEATKP